MIGNDELLVLLEDHDSLMELFTIHGLTPDELEDRVLAEMIDEAMPLWKEITTYLNTIQNAVEEL